MAYVKKTKAEMISLGIERAQKENLKVVQMWGESSFIVVNDEGDTAYKVDVDNQSAVIHFVSRCSCPHYTNRGIPCKHMFKVALDKELAIQM